MARPTLRSFLFWPHLVSGVLAGLVIAVMSITGLALAFGPQLIASADREARIGPVPAPGSARLPVDELVARAKAARPGLQVSGITQYAEPGSAVLVASGRTGGVYVDPTTGAVRELGAQGLRAGLHTLEDWHRFLGAEGDSRPVGKALTGAANALFLFLALSGLYLWFPRRWSRGAVRSTLWFRGGLKGKARDFNWHNVIGFWMLPVLIVLTASGMVISYRWASNLVFTLSGSPVPAGPGPGAAPAVQVPAPPPGTKPLPLEQAFAQAARQVPAWESLTLRLGGAPGGGAPGGAAPGGAAPGGAAAAQGGRAEAPAGERATAGERAAAGERAGSGERVAPDAQPGSGERAAASERGARSEGATAPRAEGRSEGGAPRAPRGPQALAFTVREPNAWPRFATVSLSLDPFTGQVLKREGYADGTPGRRARSWLRFLHTGEALGLPGQALAALASLGGAFLVWTGFALAWRRFFPRRKDRPQAPAASAPPDAGRPATDAETSAA